MLSGPFPDGTAVARFSQPAAQKEVCTLDTLTWSPQVILEAVSDDSMKRNHLQRFKWFISL